MELAGSGERPMVVVVVAVMELGGSGGRRRWEHNTIGGQLN